MWELDSIGRLGWELGRNDRKSSYSFDANIGGKRGFKLQLQETADG